MKLIVVSDIHGRSERLTEVLKMHRDADALIFLGDGLRDIWRADADTYGFPVYSVRGNCDGLSLFGVNADAPDELTVSFESFKFLIMHGHTRNVKGGEGRAVAAALEAGADVLLYGHTHEAVERYLPEGSEILFGKSGKPLYIFNPGSLGDRRAEFGIIEIRGGQILFSHGSVEN